MSIIDKLNTNGIIKLSNIYSLYQIQKMSDIYNNSWSKIKSNWPKKWFQIIMNENINDKYDSFMGIKLYDNKKQAFYKNTQMVSINYVISIILFFSYTYIRYRQIGIYSSN